MAVTVFMLLKKNLLSSPFLESKRKNKEIKERVILFISQHEIPTIRFENI